MEPGLIHLVRWALYIDMGLMFGMPAVAQAVGGREYLVRWRGQLIFAGLVCIPLSIFGFLLSVSEMADVALGALDSSLVLTLLTGSALGLALIARCIAALGYAVLLAKRWSSAAMIAGGVATVSLAWLGHGGSSQGALGYLRLIGDMLHLLAASAWIGALALFLTALLKVRPRNADEVARLSRMLSNFAVPGSIIVATLILTGLSNMLFIASPPVWLEIAHDAYGKVLLGKLALFMGMLALAAVNRFVLVSRLSGRKRARVVQTALASIAIEATAALAILALVAWLGTLNPLAA